MIKQVLADVKEMMLVNPPAMIVMGSPADMKPAEILWSSLPLDPVGRSAKGLKHIVDVIEHADAPIDWSDI